MRAGARRRAATAAAALVLGCLPACSAASGGAGGEERTLTVLAAASLTETFNDLARSFEAGHPGVDVRLAFDSSATLAQQVVQGAPADVLATADRRTMATAVDAGQIAGDPVVFATNQMVLVTPADNPADITAFDDLDDPSVIYVACVESAPCGAVAADLLARNHVSADPRSLEIDVKAVLTRVELDEADAGLVYASDAVAAGDRVRTVGIPGSAEHPNPYVIGVTTGSTQGRLARRFVDLVRSPEGRRTLREAGFGAVTGARP